jgi:3-oxoacyl-[acyl-carrier-protein] synthase II
MKSPRRVVITGLGVVSPIGIGKDAFWKNLIAGKSGVSYITAFDASTYPCRVAAEVKDFDPVDFMHARRTRHRGRFSQFAVAAAKLALQDSGLDSDPTAVHRAVACIGTALNGSGDVYETARVGFQKTGLEGIPIMSGVEFAAHAPVSHISSELGLRGQGMSIASACSTGLDAIQWGWSRIQEHEVDVVLAGSTEAPIFEFCFATLCALGALSKFDSPPLRASRPYDLKRSGLVLGEGAAICVLEDFDKARDRSATIYAELLGFAAGNEGGFGNRMDASELALQDAITTALRGAGASPQSIDYINAHGNSLPDYDLIETRAFHKALGPAVYNIPISSIKSMIGHAMGAAASLQVASTCLTLKHSIIPPTINYDTPDPECDLDYVPNTARVSRVRTAMINAHAMGGTHSVLILGAPPA